MWNVLIQLFLQFVFKSYILADGTYECGDHGRFEYCIDEIPGCVIGCHCHPGYYFDTSTKICEPNTKLIELHRRNNAVKTARIQANDVTPTSTYDSGPALSTDKIEGSVDEIAKDANDLGDWLYNQFFKTIENQVINNTNDKDILTRRSGLQPAQKTSKQNKKSRKSGKSLRQKGKKEKLRKKLLRITENDSLFDISSKSSSDSSDSSSSGDLSSIEYEVDESDRHKHDDDEHGHKKIVMINKKPKQPLPSFIFLPNMDTPFYPPIGLPAPPIVPMYPIVPVPPVPLCPITGCIEIPDTSMHTSTSSTSIASSTPTATAYTTSSAATTTSTGITTVITSDAPESTGNLATTDSEITSDVPKTDTRALRVKNKKKKNKLLNYNRDDIGKKLNSLSYFEQQKLMQKLKERMGNPSASLLMPPWKKLKKKYSDRVLNQNGDSETSMLDNNLVDTDFYNNDRNQKPTQEDGSLSDNVDFKYISELIHHVNINNKSNNLPPIEYNPPDDVELYRSPKVNNDQSSEYSVPFDITDNRRTHRPMKHISDESYYAKLGRQIATLIRGANEKDELKPSQNKNKKDLFLNNNSPTSFWERSVRSPFTYFKTKNKKFEYLKRSNELLFDIENKVEIIASTTPSLTLQEIENIVKVMQAAKKETRIKNGPILMKAEVSHKNFNIDLWPHKSSDTSQPSVLPYLNKIEQLENANVYATKKSNITFDTNLPNMRMNSSPSFRANNYYNTNQNVHLKNNTHFMPLTNKPPNNNKYFNVVQSSYDLKIPVKLHRILAQNAVNYSFPNQNINPYNFQHRKYFQDNVKNYYNVNSNPEFFNHPPVLKISGVQKSYYFPEKNHFDYIY